MEVKGMKGRIIVVEGLDAAGKKTQALMLAGRLKKSGKKTCFATFPTYEKTVFGRLVGKYLKGELKLSPFTASLVFALDRLQFRDDFAKKLAEGAILVLDRYVNSNQAYQAARLPAAQRAAFIKWLDAVESPMPAPAAVVYLNVPAELGELMLQGRGAKMKRFKGKDVHEKSLDYQREVGRVYLAEAKRKKWIMIECSFRRGDEIVMKSREEIREDIWKALRARGIV